MINEFKGKYYFLSNFYETPIVYDGLTYQNNEAAFQAAKTTSYEEREKFTYLIPSEAKRLGRKVALRSDWEEVKDKIMYEICKAKFSQWANLKHLLLETGDTYLEEGTTGWHDNIWGNCNCEKCKNIPGENRLGKILMKVREELRNE